MAGGSGQRLWPLSRKHRPKQIIPLEGQSLLQRSVERVSSMFPVEKILIVTNAEYADIVSKHIPDIPKENILGEPVGRDTANAIGLAATVLAKRAPGSLMAVFSADQIIEPVEPLQEALKKSIAFLENRPDALFTFGIRAAYAHTGLGYLKKGNPNPMLGKGVFPVEAFKEKPNKSTASKYIRSGKYCWNSGMFVWYVETILKQIEHFLPHNAERIRKIGQAWDTPQQEEILNSEFQHLQKISIDYGILERATDVFMCQLDCHWVDIGAFNSLAETIGVTDDDENMTSKITQCQWLDSRNNIAISNSQDHLIAAIGIEDLIIVHTDDATLICRRRESDRLKDLLDNMSSNEELQRFL